MNDVFEPEEVLDQIGGSTELLREMIEIFRSVYPDDMRNIEESLRSGDPETVRRAVHRMKGSVSNFGKRRAYRLALEMEDEARKNDLSKMDRRLNELRKELDSLLVELSRYMENC
jgi:HPt (histidine-containing phosphotransfer) domain-containing protein